MDPGICLRAPMNHALRVVVIARRPVFHDRSNQPRVRRALAARRSHRLARSRESGQIEAVAKGRLGTLAHRHHVKPADPFGPASSIMTSSTPSIMSRQVRSYGISSCSRAATVITARATVVRLPSRCVALTATGPGPRITGTLTENVPSLRTSIPLATV